MHKRLFLALVAAAALVGGFFLATTVFTGPDSSGDPLFLRPIDALPSEYKELKPGDADFGRFPADFSDFPLYWLGDEFQGHSLRHIIRDVLSPQSGLWTQNSVRFLYGSCAPEEIADGGCPPPLQMIVEPYCLKPPSRMLSSQASGIGKLRGGAETMTIGGGLRVWTGEATIKIYAATPDLLDAAAASFYSSNALGPAGAGDTLPAPNRDCSDYETVPLSLN